VRGRFNRPYIEGANRQNGFTGTLAARQKAKAKAKAGCAQMIRFQLRNRGKIGGKRGKIFGCIGANVLRIKAHKSKRLGGNCLRLAGCYPHSKSCPKSPQRATEARKNKVGKEPAQ